MDLSITYLKDQPELHLLQ